MQYLDDIFFNEFTQMMRQLKSINGNVSLSDIPLSDDLAKKCVVLNKQLVRIKGITDEVYSGLNDTTAILWVKPNLARRKYDSAGKFIQKDGKYVFEEVDVPHECVAIISDKQLGVKTKYKPVEKFVYVDFLTKDGDDNKRKYIYIVPRKYCFKVTQTALIVSHNKMTRAFYSGVSVSCQNGNILFLYVIPFMPSSTQKAFRVLATGTDPNSLFNLAGEIFKYWVNVGYAFNPMECEMLDCTKGRSNMAFESFAGRIDLYSEYSDKSLDISEQNAESFVFEE